VFLISLRKHTHLICAIVTSHFSPSYHNLRKRVTATYSLHKHRLPVEPMMVVTKTEYIHGVWGPYLADTKNNDAKITTHIMKTHARVDCGFRDLVGTYLLLEMPHFLERRPQFLTAEANDFRLVTKV